MSKMKKSGAYTGKTTIKTNKNSGKTKIKHKKS